MIKLSLVHLDLENDLIQSLQFFSKMRKKISVGWSSRCKFFWNALDPTLVTFLEIQKNFHLKKNTSVGLNWCFDAILVFFFGNRNFFISQKKCWMKCISKKFTTTGLANTCIFFAFLKKITMTGSSHFLSPNEQG